MPGGGVVSRRVTLWLGDGDELIADPAAAGYAEKDCGSNMLVRPGGGYCERITAYRVHFAAVDGSFSKSTVCPARAIEIIRERGCLETDGHVSFDGIVRFGGIQCRTGGKSWYALDLAAVRKALPAPKKWMVEHSYTYGWDDAEWTVEVDGKTVAQRFDTKAEAEAEIDEHVRDCKDAKMSGYSRSSYRAVEVST